MRWWTTGKNARQVPPAFLLLRKTRGDRLQRPLHLHRPRVARARVGELARASRCRRPATGRRAMAVAWNRSLTLVVRTPRLQLRPR